MNYDQRVTSFRFMGDQLDAVATLAITTTEKTVYVWDYVLLQIIAESTDGHTGASISCSSVSPISGIIATGDSKGNITIWDHVNNILLHYSPDSVKGNGVFSLSFSPHSPNLIVIGYNNGTLMVFDIESGGIVHQLIGHSNQIHSLSWSETPDMDMFTIPLDQVLSDAETNIPKFLISSSKDETIKVWDAIDYDLVYDINVPKPKQTKNNRIWISTCWNPKSIDEFVSTTRNGGLIQWKLNHNTNKYSKKNFEYGHNRMVFSVNNVFKNRIISISMDRKIIIWDTRTRKKRTIFPSLGGFAYKIDISPLDPSRLAIGVGDNTIQVWNVGKVGYKTVTLWKGLQSKITCIKWHTKETGVLAFGSQDGKVGIYNVFSVKLTQLKTYHKGTVYSLDFGPHPQTEESFTALYSCGGGIILVHDLWKPKNKALDVNNLILQANSEILNIYKMIYPSLDSFPKRTEIRFSKDETMISIGNAKGLIEIYSVPQFKLINIFNDHKKMINRLDWKIDRNILASDLSDNTVRPIHNIRGHSGPINTCAWSLINQKFIYTGSSDQTVRQWVYDEQVYENPPDPKPRKRKRKRKKNRGNANKAAEETFILSNKDIDKSKESSIFRINNQHGSIDDFELCVQNIQYQNQSETGIRNNLLVSDGPAFLDIKGKEYLDKNEIDKYLLTEFWKGNIIPVLDFVIKNDRITPSWLSISPLAGIDIWMQMTEIYAKKLEDIGKYHQSSMYYISIHQIENAINVYLKANMYPDALALAKSRLSPRDPWINSIIEEWGIFFEKRNRYIAACNCYITIGEYERAIAVVHQLGDQENLERAIKLAEMCNHEEAYEQLTQQLLKMDPNTEDIVDA
eukprot:TRINITY_DN8254_c0_g1_i2.p1 TRINITY_DN8254_c0_g1~~TRINITY_DN8254_c0_g1_i2.p1  ORF type:complete len:914 (+),score=189.56 TRINITY_DN8254_c0_g1_i2:188-2743(+)